MSIPPPALALQAALKADSGLNTLFGGTPRVYWPQLPASETPLMPRKAIVLRNAGGPGDASLMAVARARVDVRCFGETPFEAERLGLATYDCLKHLARHIWGSTVPTLVESAIPSSGALDLWEQVEGGTGPWPFSFRPYLVTVAERAAA